MHKIFTPWEWEYYTMTRILANSRLRLSLGIAFLCAISLACLLPAVASAHTIPLSSHLTNRAVLSTPYAGGSTPGTLDGPALFNLIVITLVELGAIFWVGAQFWLNFVLQSSSEKHPTEKDLNAQVEQRFERRFSLPTLALLLLANLGVLYGHTLTLASNHWDAALNWQLLSTQASSGQFGTYWLLRVGVIILAMLIGLYMVTNKQRPRAVNQVLPLLNLFLGAVLFLAMTMSGDTTAVNSIMLPYAVVIDWLHLVGAALWIGSMLYILLIYLPALKPRSLNERARSLLAVLPQYSPLAIAGVVLLAATGLLSASFHLTALDQFFTTAYGRSLLIKVLLVAALIVSSAYHVFWLRPRLQKEERKYIYAKERLQKAQATPENVAVGSEARGDASQPAVNKLLVQQVKLREERLAKKTNLMTRILRWEPWLGVAVIVCVGLMSVFANTLTATAQTPGQQTGPSSAVAGPFTGAAPTSDGKYNVTLHVSPNHFGTNVFTVQVTDVATGKSLDANAVSVSIFTTMLDMDMGTDSVSLTPNGKGGFSGSGDFSMGGNWDVKVQLRTTDGARHEANFKFYTPF